MAASEKEVRIKISGEVDNSLNVVSQKVDKAFSKMTKLAKSATLVGGAAAAAALTGAVEAGSSFESQMSAVGAISGAVEKEIIQMENKAREMGATTQFTATESGQAMEYMAMAGWKTSEMLNGIEGIMNLAAASGEDLASTSDIVTDALSAFKMEAKDSAHFSDVLAAASSNSNTNVGILGESFKEVAPVAGSMKYSIEDVSLTLGLMANQSVKGSKAGTSLKTAIANMAAPTQKMQKAMKKYNISLKDSDGKTKSLRSVIDDVRESIGGLSSKTERAAAISTIFGKEAMPAMSAIVNASEKDYRKLAGSIDNASGAAERMAKIRLDNLQGDVTIFQSALEGKGIELYDELKEPMRDIVQGATDWLEEIDVARVVDDVKDFGEAVLNFSEPFLEVGEWMIKNPDAIAGPLAGIGGAITGYKLLDTIPELGEGLEGLISGVTASPYIAGGALAVGALTGIGTAIVETERAAANASLDDHFGDIALSMDQIQRAADNLIGSKKLENMEELMSSIKISEGFEREMKKAAKSIEKIEWKVSAGLKLDDKDMDELEKSTKDYIQAAQDQIEQQGYTVNVAAKVLFGNSDKGEKLIEEDNSIFADLEKKAQGLADRINSTLQKAMEKGLTPDLKQALDGYLKEMGELTRTMADAETEASWDILKADFSGKDLDADTYQKMQDAVNKNIETVEKTEKEARNTLINNARKKFAAGHISEEERQTQVDDANKQYEENVKEAKARGIEFQYNTLMDTYGENLMSGDMSRGDKNAVHDMVVDMMGGATGEMKDKLVTIEKATSGTYVTDFIDNLQLSDSLTDAEKEMQKVRNMAAEYKYGEETAVKPEKEEKRYSNLILGAVSPYLPSAIKNMKESTTGLQEMPVNILNGFVTAVPTALVKMEEAAEKGGIASAEAFGKALTDEMAKINPINIPIEFSPPGASITTEKGKKKDGGTSRIIYPSIGGHAEGIISNKAHIAAVSEGDKTEAIIPIDGSARSRRLYEATGKLMGYNKNQGQGVTFAPTINITLTGRATAGDKNEIRSIVQKELEKQYKKMIRDKKRFDMSL